jgi:hypothetical protein
MSYSDDPAKSNRKLPFLNITLAVLAGQVGCLTLVIVLLAVMAGLWLDGYFHTKPVLTLILVITSIPVSVLVMLGVVRTAVSRLKIEKGGTKPVQQEEETNIGGNKNP